MTIDDYLHSMEMTFTADLTKGKHVVLQYVFSGSQTGVCHAIIDDGALRLAHGPHPSPTATVHTDFDLWMRLLSYEEDAWLAYQDGRYSVAGDMGTLMESDSWFNRKPPR